MAQRQAWLQWLQIDLSDLILPFEQQLLSIHMFNRCRRAIWHEGKPRSGSSTWIFPTLAFYLYFRQFGAAKLGGSHNSAKLRAAEQKLQKGLSAIVPPPVLARGKRAVFMIAGGPVRPYILVNLMQVGLGVSVLMTWRQVGLQPISLMQVSLKAAGGLSRPDVLIGLT